MRKLLLAVILILYSSTKCFSAEMTNLDRSRSLLREGVQAYKSGDSEKAIKLFESSHDAAPESPYPLRALVRAHGSTFYRIKLDYDLAVAACRRLDLTLSAETPGALERDSYEGLLDCGELFLRGGERTKTILFLQKFLKNYPDYYDLGKVHNLRGVALFQLSRYEEAEEAFRESINVDPDYLEPYVNLRAVFNRMALYEQAQVNNRMGRNEDALELIEWLNARAKGFLPGMALKGDILADMGKTDEALNAYGEALNYDHTHWATHGIRLTMASLLEKRGQIEEALDLLNQNAARFQDLENDPTEKEISRLTGLLKDKP